MGDPKKVDLLVWRISDMLDDHTKQDLRRALDREMNALRGDKEARARLDRQIQDHEEKIAAIRRLLDEGTPTGFPEDSQRGRVRAKPRNPRPGTVTDEIRRLFEANPLITAGEAIDHVQSKFEDSKIGPQSFSIWNGYFKHGRYRMDGEKYRIRYGQEPPY